MWLTFQNQVTYIFSIENNVVILYEGDKRKGLLGADLFTKS